MRRHCEEPKATKAISRQGVSCTEIASLALTMTIESGRSIRAEFSVAAGG